MANYHVNGTSQGGDSELPKRFKRYKFEFGPGQLILWSFALLLGLSWMFVFGVLIGRGIPLVDTQDLSFKAEIMKFIGLGRKPPPPAANAAETWATPDKILESLDYYDDLARKAPQPLQSAEKKPAVLAVQSVPVKNPIPGPDKAAAPTPPQTVDASSSSVNSEESENQSPPAAAQASGSGSEHFTILVASLRVPEHAEKLLEKLRSKGYSPRMEEVNLSGSGKWQRILLGSFQTREEALKFAAEVNRKERMEGLVIRETH